MGITTAEWQSMKAVSVARDTFLEATKLLFTAPALVFAAYGITKGIKRGQKWTVILCIGISICSLLFLVFIANDWYHEVYLYSHGTWGQW